MRPLEPPLNESLQRYRSFTTRSRRGTCNTRFNRSQAIWLLKTRRTSNHDQILIPELEARVGGFLRRGLRTTISLTVWQYRKPPALRLAWAILTTSTSTLT